MLTIMKNTIETQVKQMLKDYLGEVAYKDCGEISAKSNLKYDLGMDSLDICCMLMEVEKAYNFNLSADDEQFLTVNPTIRNFVNVIYKNTK